jgi:hypothetical protein
MSIGITNASISTKAAAGSTIGVLSLIDYSGFNRPANYTLDENSAGLFGITGNNLVMLRTVPPGIYSIEVYANAQYVALSSQGNLIITVTAT